MSFCETADRAGGRAGTELALRGTAGSAITGRGRPRMKRTISTGTSVMASKDEKPTANVFVQASGRNIRPSWASSRKTGRKDTTMMSSEKKIAGPTCFAESNKIRLLSGSETDFSD